MGLIVFFFCVGILIIMQIFAMKQELKNIEEVLEQMKQGQWYMMGVTQQDHEELECKILNGVKLLL